MTETKGKHIPIRMCVICRQRVPKSALTRFTAASLVLEPPVPDTKQREQGRGLYLCNAPRCREAFSRKNAKRKAKGQEL